MWSSSCFGCSPAPSRRSWTRRWPPWSPSSRVSARFSSLIPGAATSSSDVVGTGSRPAVELDLAVVAVGDVVVRGVRLAVVEAAEQSAAGDTCRAALCPGDVVGGVAPGGGSVAAQGGAAAVADGGRDPLDL